MIYCNMTECAFRKELEEPHKRDSMIPVTYTGYCGLSGIVQKKREFLSNGRYKRVEAICNSFLPEGGDKVTKIYKDIIACDSIDCSYNVDGLCGKEDIYVTPENMYHGNDKEVLPVCTSKSSNRAEAKINIFQYPKR